MLIINGTVHTMEGLTIPGGYVDIRGDKIAGTGRLCGRPLPPGDVRGLHRH